MSLPERWIPVFNDVVISIKASNTVVMVTHNSFFADIADRVIRVKNGTVQSVETNDSPKDAEEVNW